MTYSTLEAPGFQEQHSVCPHCGGPLYTANASRLRFILETGIGLVAGLALVLMLVPLGIFAWKSCTDFLSGRVSHSIVFQPLEDWTRY